MSSIKEFCLKLLGSQKEISWRRLLAFLVGIGCFALSDKVDQNGLLAILALYMAGETAERIVARLRPPATATAAQPASPALPAPPVQP